MVAATTGTAVGTCNVAGDGVLATSQAVAMNGRPWVPVLPGTAGPLNWLLRRAGLASMPSDQLDALAFGRVVDTTRMRTELGFGPAYTTRAAFESFLAAGRDRDRPEQHAEQELM
jgi:UDP-glucose 4-epimerase